MRIEARGLGTFIFMKICDGLKRERVLSPLNYFYLEGNKNSEVYGIKKVCVLSTIILPKKLTIFL
jgi:hypothetical protein